MAPPPGPDPRPRITHVIFDMDGLLLDTEPFYTEATSRIATRFGKHFDWSIKGRMIGTTGPVSARIVIEALDLPLTVAEFLRERDAVLRDLFPTAQPMPGAVELTARLERCAVPQAVATSSAREMFRLKTRSHRDWFARFAHVVTSDEVEHGKPAPDLYLEAARRLGADPAACLVFEDAPAGTRAGIAAGMTVIAVPDPHMDPAEYAGAAEVLPTLEAFDAERWGLPGRDGASWPPNAL